MQFLMREIYESFEGTKSEIRHYLFMPTPALKLDASVLLKDVNKEVRLNYHQHILEQKIRKKTSGDSFTPNYFQRMEVKSCIQWFLPHTQSKEKFSITT